MRASRAWAVRALAIAAGGVIAVMTGSAACFDSPRPSCAFLCGNDLSCPEGYTCATDGWCKREGLADDFVCDGIAIDASVADAPADAATDGPEFDAPDFDAPIDADVDAEIDAPTDAPIDAAPAMLAILSANPLSFGSIAQTQSTTRAVQVQNSGGTTTSPITIAISGDPAFARIDDASDTCTGAMLAPMSTCAFAIRYTPVDVGTDTGIASASATEGGSASINLAGTGNAMLTSSPSSASFGSVMVGMSAARTLTIANGGTVPSGTIAVTPPAAAEFTITGGTCPGMALAPATNCTIELQFAPAATGAQSSSLTIEASPGGPRVVNLSGTGI